MRAFSELRSQRIAEASRERLSWIGLSRLQQSHGISRLYGDTFGQIWNAPDSCQTVDYPKFGLKVSP